VKKITFIIGLALICACGRRSEAPTLPDERIVAIICDLAVADAAVSQLGGFERDSFAHMYYKQVFERHNTTLEVYEKDLRLLSVTPQRLQHIYAQAMDLLKADSLRQE
jgi:Domain of unknown function (DUF4296)